MMVLFKPCVAVVVAAAIAAATTTNMVPCRDIDLINYRMVTPLLQNKRGRRKGKEKRSKKEEKSEIDAVLFNHNCCCYFSYNPPCFDRITVYRTV